MRLSNQFCGTWDFKERDSSHMPMTFVKQNFERESWCWICRPWLSEYLKQEDLHVPRNWVCNKGGKANYLQASQYPLMPVRSAISQIYLCDDQTRTYQWQTLRCFCSYKSSRDKPGLNFSRARSGRCWGRFLNARCFRISLLPDFVNGEAICHKNELRMPGSPPS